MALGAGAGVGGANLLARGLTNQGMVNAAAQRTTIDPRTLDAQLRGLAGAGMFSQPDRFVGQ